MMATNPTAPGSRKRPAPTQPPAPSSIPSSLRIDALLAKYARHLPPGGTISIQLIKGSTSKSVDPIAVRKAVAKKERQLQKNNTNNSSSAVNSGNDSDGGGGGGNKAAAEAAAKVAAEKLTLEFPRVAKFPETVTKPTFYTGGLKDGRMYEEEVPLAKVSDLSVG